MTPFWPNLAVGLAVGIAVLAFLVAAILGVRAHSEHQKRIDEQDYDEGQGYPR